MDRLPLLHLNESLIVVGRVIDLAALTDDDTLSARTVYAGFLFTLLEHVLDRPVFGGRQRLPL